MDSPNLRVLCLLRLHIFRVTLKPSKHPSIGHTHDRPHSRSYTRRLRKDILVQVDSVPIQYHLITLFHFDTGHFYHFTILVNSSPQVILLAVDLYEGFVNVEGDAALGQ